MKIPVSRISSEGLELSQTYDPKEWDMGRYDLEVTAPIKAVVFVTKQGDDLFARVRVISCFKLECVRCLKRFEISVEEKLDLDYNVKGKTNLDITADIRQEMIMRYPMKPLCNELCQGLCPICGKDLNEGKCNCQMKT